VALVFNVPVTRLNMSIRALSQPNLEGFHLAPAPAGQHDQHQPDRLSRHRVHEAAALNGKSWDFAED
jgi:hypothetical protein